MQNCQSGDGFKQIAETALATNESESENFEHVKEPISPRARYALAKYGLAATPSDIAADYHMEFAEGQIHQLEQTDAAKERVSSEPNAVAREEEVV